MPKVPPRPVAVPNAAENGTVAAEVVRFIPSNLTKGIVALAVSFVATGFAARWLAKANKDAVIAGAEEIENRLNAAA